SGVIAPERCFFVIPRDSGIRLPSDLQGITPGDYNPNRADGRIRRAVAPFCGDVRDKIAELGVIPPAVLEELLRLAVEFECCEWITISGEDQRVEKKLEDERVRRKWEIFEKMVSLCRRRAPNKTALSRRS